jgi:hypothetical protein
MELSRFHYSIDQIVKDYNSINIENEFAALINHLSTLVNQPGNSDISQNFKNQLNSFRDKLSASHMNSVDDDLFQTINDLDLTELVGDKLFSKIWACLNENQITPNLAVIAIEKLRLEVVEKYASIIAINTSFTKLKVVYSELAEGDTEILIKLPIEAETITLSDFSKEASEWHKICQAISETFDPNRERITIRAIGSGSLLIYLATTATCIFGIAKCMKGINSILTEVVRSKELLKQLIGNNTPPSIITSLDEHNAGKAKIDISNLATNLVDEFYKGGDISRKNELKIALSHALTKLSHKLATGAKISLRLSAPKEPIIAEGETATKEQKEILAEIKQFKLAQNEVTTSSQLLDYKEHSADLVAALPSPSEESAVNANDETEKPITNTKTRKK